MQAMRITTLPSTGNSSKFQVTTKRGDFMMALSHTLRTKVWKLGDVDAEFAAAKELAKAIVSRHNPVLPFQTLYVFAEHNCDASLVQTVQNIRKYGIGR